MFETLHVFFFFSLTLFELIFIYVNKLPYFNFSVTVPKPTHFTSHYLSEISREENQRKEVTTERFLHNKIKKRISAKLMTESKRSGFGDEVTPSTLHTM